MRDQECCISVEPLTTATRREAANIAVQADVGTRAQVNRFFRQVLNQHNYAAYVAMCEGRVVGLIGWYQDKGHWAGKSLGKLFPYGGNIYWTSYFAVDEKLRGHGVGTQLVHHLFQVLADRRARELWTYTSRARVFYQKLGFTFVKRAKIEGELHDFLKFTF